MKKAALLATFLSLITFLSIISGCSGRPAPRRLRIGIQPIPHFAPILVAKHKRWVEEGLAGDVEYTTFLSGPSMNEAIGGKSIDIGFMGDAPAIILKAAGVEDIKLIGIGSSSPTCLALVVPLSSNISSPKVLKGKTVGTIYGSYGHHLLVKILEQHGLRVEDINMLNMRIIDAVAALEARQIDAASVWDPWLSQLLERKKGRVLQDGRGITRGTVVLVARTDYIKAHPEMVRKFLKIYLRSVGWVRDHPAQTLEIVHLETGYPCVVLARSLASLDFSPDFSPEAISDIEKTAKFLTKLGVIKAKVDIKSFIWRGAF